MCICVNPSAGIACLFLHRPLYLFFCFHASLHVQWLFLQCVCSLALPVALGLGGPIFSWIIAFKDMHHEFLIHCMFLLSYRGSQYDLNSGKKLNSSRDCVCVTLTGHLRERRCKEEGMSHVWCAHERKTRVPRKKQQQDVKTKLNFKGCPLPLLRDLEKV